MNDCRQFESAYESYARNTLDPAERAAFEAHLARGCPACQKGIELAKAVVAEPTPPPHRKTLSLLVWTVAAALVFISVYTVRETRKLQDQIVTLQQNMQQERDSAARLAADRAGLEAALAIIRNPATRTVELKSPAAQPPLRAYWQQTAGLVLAAGKMPSPPGDFTYQLWILPKKGNPVSAGTFKPGAQGSVVYHTVPSTQIAGAASLAVTVEPSGGSPQPTTTPIWVGPIT